MLLYANENICCFKILQKPIIYSAAVARTFGSWSSSGSRRGRMNQLPTLAPSVTQSVLLKAYGEANEDVDVHSLRHGESKK